MSDFKAKMHQIRFRLGLRPRPRWGSLQRSPDPLAGFKGPTSKERGREGRGRVGKGGEGRREGRAGEGGEIRPRLLKIYLDWRRCQSSPKVAYVITSWISTHMQYLLTIPQGISFPRMREIAHQKCLLGFFFPGSSKNGQQARPLNRFSRKISQTTWFPVVRG